MAFIADVLLTAGALAAAFYCWILGRRLRQFTNLEQGVGGAVAVLSAQVDDLSKALAQAQSSSSGSVEALNKANDRADASAQRLELLMASLHDLPDAQTAQPNEAAPANPFFVRANDGATVAEDNNR